METRVDGDAPDQVLKNRWAERLFPTHSLGRADYVLGIATLVACFFLFLHPDLPMIGFCSLSYLSGNPLEFYENVARASASIGYPTVCGYPPSTYATLALWLYPLKAFGLIPGAETFPTFQTYFSNANFGALPTFQTYWLKALTTVAYFASGVVFYRIARVYWPSHELAKYATAVWLTMPLAVFSQFILSHVDIFHVLLTLLGILMFLKGRLYLGALCFGFAITFKYFPAFVFLPLLLLFEKRLSRIVACGLVFIVPLALVELVYYRSEAYRALVHNFHELEMVYRVSLDFLIWQMYMLFAAFSVLCGVAYFTDLERSAQLRSAAYIWLVASILPFLLIFWHPQWLIFTAPAIALTSVLSCRFSEHSTLDLFGMFLFVAGVSLAFPLSVDAATIFKVGLLGINLDYSFLVAQLFEWFGGHSTGVFLSAFSGYLILQLILKFNHMFFGGAKKAQVGAMRYGRVRWYFYLGLLIFVLPAAIAMFKDKMNNESVVCNVLWEQFGEMLGDRTLEQTFIASGDSLTWVSLPLVIFSQRHGGNVVMAIVDSQGRLIANATRHASELKNLGWNHFAVRTALNKGDQYRIRLISTNAEISWIASSTDNYRDGQAIVDGIAQDSDFAFRIGFPR